MAVEYSRDSNDWIGCYKGDSDLWCPDAYCHPAKMSPGLCFRILDHLEELGLLQQGDVILDPMCGIGTTLLCSAVRGFKAYGVELETRFKDLAEANKAHLEKKLGHPIDLTILQGDSRNLSTLLSERGLIMVSSPPYADSGAKDRGDTIKELTSCVFHNRSYRPGDTYGQTPGQIGNLPEGKIIVTSPPYENVDLDGRRPNAIKNIQIKANRGELHGRETKRIAQQAKFSPHAQNSLDDYGNTPNQIGQEHGESYWSAMKQVYTESLKVADVMVLITKDPTRNKAIHPLGQMTADLITSIGWRIVDWHRAILYDTQEQGDLFGGSKKLYKGRVSFFKRLSLQNGSPAADHEDVIFAVNPNGRRSGICEISSPPYSNRMSSTSNNTDNIRRPCHSENYYGSTPGQIGNLKE